MSQEVHQAPTSVDEEQGGQVPPPGSHDGCCPPEGHAAPLGYVNEQAGEEGGGDFDWHCVTYQPMRSARADLLPRKHIISRVKTKLGETYS